MQKKLKSHRSADGCQLQVSIYDGQRQPLTRTSVLYRIWDGSQRFQRTRETTSSSVKWKGLPFHDNLDDRWTVIASADDHEQVGLFPVKLEEGTLINVDLMILPKRRKLNFAQGQWADVSARFPPLLAGSGQATGQERYEELLEHSAGKVAGLLNMLTALEQTMLQAGIALDYLREIVWDESLEQDRFFAFADHRLLEQVLIGKSTGKFSAEAGASLFHPGATRSFKQEQFGEANAQITFHEKTKRRVSGVECLKIEVDIDYYKDLGAHFFLEVLPNKLGGGLTNPELVYMLRWIAGRRAGVPEFEPPFTIVPD
jgi:hypothetical protein